MTRWPWLYSILRRCRNSFLNSCLRELCYLAAIHEFKIRAVHVPGVSNCYTDILSRWDSNNLVGRTEFLARQFTSCTCPWWYVSIWQWFLTKPFIVLGYPELRRLRRDLKHSQRAFHTPRRAPPVSPSLFLRLSSFLLLNSNPRSATLLCAFLFAFFLMARLANIVLPSLRQFDPRRHLTRGDVVFTAHGLFVTFRCTKQFSLVNDCFIFLYLVFLAVHYVLSAHIAVWLSWFPLTAPARFFFYPVPRV